MPKNAEQTVKIDSSSGEVCPLCDRQLAGICNRHHLIPLSKGGKNTETVLMHKICHDKIHAVYKETELKRYYHTIDRIKESEEIQRFIKWLQNKPSEFYDTTIKRKK